MGKVKQITTLTNGNGIQHLLDEAYTVLRNPLAIFDTNYKLMAYTDVPCDDDLWRELITTSSFSQKTLNLFAAETFIEQVANSDTVAVLKSTKLVYNRLSGSIVNAENVRVANLVMVGYNEPGDEESVRAFEELVNKLSLEIQGDAYYISYGRAFHEAMINQLINGEIDDPKLNTAHIQILYDGFEDYIYVAVIDTSQSSFTQGDSRVFFRDLIEKNHKLSKFAHHENQTIMLMSSKHKYPSKAGLFDKSHSLLDKYNLFVGISDSFDNLYELRQYYDQAVDVLQSRIAQGERRVYFPEMK